MVHGSRLQSNVAVATLGILLAQLGLLSACSSGDTPPPPIFSRQSGGSAGDRSATGGEGGQGEGGERATNCTAKREGCSCDEAGSTTPCKVYETFGDYTTCTTGVLTCADDLTWGTCIGERTTQPASVVPGGTGTREN